jgi:hypothetical protein
VTFFFSPRLPSIVRSPGLDACRSAPSELMRRRVLRAKVNAAQGHHKILVWFKAPDHCLVLRRYELIHQHWFRILLFDDTYASVASRSGEAFSALPIRTEQFECKGTTLIRTLWKAQSLESSSASTAITGCYLWQHEVVLCRSRNITTSCPVNSRQIH